MSQTVRIIVIIAQQKKLKGMAALGGCRRSGGAYSAKDRMIMIMKLVWRFKALKGFGKWNLRNVLHSDHCAELGRVNCPGRVFICFWTVNFQSGGVSRKSGP